MVALSVALPASSAVAVELLVPAPSSGSLAGGTLMFDGLCWRS